MVRDFGGHGYYFGTKFWVAYLPTYIYLQKGKVPYILLAIATVIMCMSTEPTSHQTSETAVTNFISALWIEVLS